MSHRDFVLGHGRFDAYPETRTSDFRRRDTPDRRAFWDHVDKTAKKVEARMQPLPDTPLLDVLRVSRHIRDMIRAGGAVTDETGSIFATLLGDLMVATDKCDGIQLRTPR